jgi:thiol-disulfide isomerase/thioredoxin/outer membrane lipoprotein-sorting protein
MASHRCFSAGDFVRHCVLVALGLLSLVGISGCNSETPPPEPRNGSELLERLVAAYHAATSYEDSGEVRFHCVIDGQPRDESYSFSVALARPNKLRMHFYDAIVVSDGHDFWASVNACPNQVLKRSAPPVLTSNDVNGTDEILTAAVTQGVAGGSIQLALLLDPEPLVPILQGSTDAPKLLAPAKIDDALCQRVEIKRDDGTLVFWIDAATSVLRRVEFPVKPYQELLSQDGKFKITELSLVADLRGARLNPKIDEKAFAFTAPPDVKLVDKLIVPGAMQYPPPKLLGSQIPDFEFIGLDGKPVTKQSLAGKVVVLEFWASWCEPCFESLPQLQPVYDEYRKHDKVVILAVNLDRAPGSKNVMMLSSASQSPIETPALDDQALKEGFARTKLTIPIVRDLGQFANTAFGVQPIPDLFILGPDGTVEDNETGVNPDLHKQLPARIEKLLAGGHLVADARERYEARVKQFEAQQGTSGAAAGQPMSKAVIAPRSQPAKLKLTKLWSVEAVKKPGNVLVVERSGAAPQILVNDGFDTVVELAARDGQVEASRVLDLPEGGKTEDRIVSYLRSAVDKDGQRIFVGSMNNCSQLHVFDANWKRLFSYPGLDVVSAGGISDVQLADLDGDGQPELNVGYYETVGVQGVSLSGKRLWRNPTLANVLRLAATSPDAGGQRMLLCAHERGNIATIDSDGQSGPSITLGNRFVRSVFADDLNGDGRSELVAIASLQAGEDILVGFDLAGRELWSQPLPLGMQQHPALEMVTAGKLLANSGRQWIIAGADGSVLVIAPDGQLLDRWHYGEAISGLAIAQLDAPTLIIATAKGIDAWRVGQ